MATAAITLGRAGGLVVYAASRDPAKWERARELGAHDVFSLGARLPERVDAVVETVGVATWAASLKALKPGGTVVVAGATSGADPPADLHRIFFLQLSVVGSTMGTRRELEQLVQMLTATSIRPVIDTVLPLSAAREGFARMARGDVFGKIVFTP